MFPPIQCSKSSYFTQWLISEYLTRINENKDLVQAPPHHSQQQQAPPHVPAPVPQLPPPPQQQQQQQTSPPPASHSSTSSSLRNLKHLFHHHTTHHAPKKNNNEYKSSNGVHNEHHHNHHHNNHHHQHQSSSKNIEIIQLLALNALEFTAPIYSFKKDSEGASKDNESKEKSGGRKEVCKCPSTRTFVQLSGHPGSFAPAGPNTVWKKMPEDQEGGSGCGREQVGSGIGMDGSLRELLQALNNNCSLDSSGASADNLPPPPSLASSPGGPLQPLADLTSINSPPSTTPITVFFNNTLLASTSTSSSSPPPPQPPPAQSASSSSSSSSSSQSTSPQSPQLLPPQIYNIPTHLLPNETQVYRRAARTPSDPINHIIPKYITETCYNSQMFLELEDLLTNFNAPNPTIMDIKLGTRTFLESEVKNSKPRPDLYQKLIAVDPTACTELEHEAKAVTKLTYMSFREKQSSSNNLGFRIEGVKIGEKGKYSPEMQLRVNFKVLRDEAEIAHVFKLFCKKKRHLLKLFTKRLEFIRSCLESSEFFMGHEVIGSSLLFIHDDEHVGVWLIDFAKTFQVVGRKLSHRGQWVMGNREDGVLTGVDNIIRLFSKVV